MRLASIKFRRERSRGVQITGVFGEGQRDRCSIEARLAIGYRSPSVRDPAEVADNGGFIGPVEPFAENRGITLS